MTAESDPAVEPTAEDADRVRALHLAQMLPGYQPGESVSGEISLWGHGSFKHQFMGRLVGAWLAGFNQHHPDVSLEYRMYGTASAIGALYTGAGNLAILGEEINPAAERAFIRARQYSPTAVKIATGSVQTNFFDYAHMVFTHRTNPIRGLSLPQLAAIFGAGQGPDGTDIRTWGQLGLTGEWVERRIRPYSWRTDMDFALFFSERVMNYGHRWNPDVVEHVHRLRPDGSQYDHGQQILDALAGDPCGLAISNVRYQGPDVRVVPLSRHHGGAFVWPTTNSLVDQSYPLTRVVPAYVDRDPKGSFNDLTREFLRYILSRQGQLALVTNSGYLPLGAQIQSKEMERLSA